MKFIVLVPANQETEADVLPSSEEVAKMNKFGEGLRSSSKGARLTFGKGSKTSMKQHGER